MHGVNQGQHRIDRKPFGNVAIRHQRMQDRRRVGQTRGLDQYPFERRHTPRQSPRRQVQKSVRQIPSYRTAKAAIGQLNETFAAGHDQLVVQSHFAELIHDHRRARPARVAQHPRDQRRLPAAQKPRDDRNRNHPETPVTQKPAPEENPPFSRRMGTDRGFRVDLDPCPLYRGKVITPTLPPTTAMIGSTQGDDPRDFPDPRRSAPAPRARAGGG